MPQRLNAQGYVDLLWNNGIDVFLRGAGRTRCSSRMRTLPYGGVVDEVVQQSRCQFSPSWPANSTDLSPIEQVWGIIKRFILQWFWMKPPIQVQQLDEAVF